jgi:hypothetical protein
MRKSLVLALLLTFSIVAPVAAAPPPNDTVAGATVVTVGTSLSLDTTEATTDAFENSLNEFCGAPVIGNAVWFTITPTSPAFVAFDVAESSFSAGAMLFEGAPSTATLLSCGPGGVLGDLAAGQQYYLMAFGDGLSPDVSGTLRLEVREAVPPPDIELTVDRFANVDRDGVVRLTGTVTCTSEDGTGFVFEIFGDLTQRVGRFLIRGFFDNFELSIPCDGASHAWEAFAIGDTGIFAGGKAATVAIAIGCTDLCNEGFVETTIQLRRGR